MVPTEELDFGDLTPVEVPVKVNGKEYVLREATADAARRYKNAMIHASQLGSDGKPVRMENIADTEPLLVSLCLFERYEHQGERRERPVLLSQVLAWPAWLVKRLFEKAKGISRLDERLTEEQIKDRIRDLEGKLSGTKEDKGTDHNGSDGDTSVKNSPATTPVGSG